MADGGTHGNVSRYQVFCCWAQEDSQDTACVNAGNEIPAICNVQISRNLAKEDCSNAIAVYAAVKNKSPLIRTGPSSLSKL